MASFVEKNDRLVHRFLEIMLGITTWAFLTSPIWLGIFYPQAMVYILTFITVYWSYLAFRHSIGLFVGYRKYREEMAMDWNLLCQKLNFSELPDKETLPPTLSALKHMIVIPVVNEPDLVLKDCIDSIFAQTFSHSQIVLVFTAEEKWAENTIARIKKLIGDRENQLYKLLFFIHPAGIPGEAIGDGGANRAWGVPMPLRH